MLVLAMCAWLALSSVAWAMPRHDDCCPSSTAAMGMMGMQHASLDHAATHTSNIPSDSCCTHAPANVPASMLPHVLEVSVDQSPRQSHRQTAPQPVYEPPLRPPVV